MEIRQFIVEHIDLIISGFTCLVVIILQVFKKKPILLDQSIVEKVLYLVPETIKHYEKYYGAGHGAEKKEACINYILKEILRAYPLTDNQLDAYKTMISLFIEQVLATPQKK